jgi:hypothetical protein
MRPRRLRTVPGARNTSHGPASHLHAENVRMLFESPTDFGRNKVVMDIVADYVSHTDKHMQRAAFDVDVSEIDEDDGLWKHPMAHLIMPFETDGKPAYVVSSAQEAKCKKDDLFPEPL